METNGLNAYILVLGINVTDKIPCIVANPTYGYCNELMILINRPYQGKMH